jgi:hypothetical protein
MSKVKAKSSPVVFPSGWSLFRETLDDFRLHLWRYLLLVGIIAIPTNLIAMSPGLAADSTVSLYVNLGSLFMTAALLWAVTRGQDDAKLKLRQIYYDGSAIVLRFILVIIVLALMVLPAAVGISLYSLGANSSGGGVSIPVQLLLAGLALLMAAPSFFWLIRFSMAIFSVAVEGEWPLVALGSARRLTLGHFWPLAGRVLQLLVWVLLVMIIPLVVFIGLASVTHFIFFIVLLQISFSLLATPIIALYTFRLYGILKGV